RQRERSARAVDLCALHRLDQRVALARVAVHRLESCGQQLSGVVTLHRVDIGLRFVGGFVRGTKCVVLRIVERVSIVQRGQPTLPPPFSNVSLKPPVDCSPAAYFQVSVTAVLCPFSAATFPIARAGCELENDVRKMFGAHMGPVISSAPAFGMIKSALLSRAAFAIAIATPECTVPTTTSTLSPLMGLFR